MALQKGKRLAARLRIALTGPTNAGKTYTALRLAYGIIKATHPNWTDEEIWDHIVLIDTERKRGLFYIGRTDLPLHTGEFYHVPIEAPYHPDKYVEALKEAYKTIGPDGVAIIDSLSHGWSYQGGVLDIKEQIAKQSGKNSYTAWNEAGQIQNELIDTIMTAPCHIISTMRSKMDYVLETNEQGKIIPVKKGLAPIQRDDTEYEFDITLMLDKDHRASIIKDVTFLNQIDFEGIVTEDLGRQIKEWQDQGIDPKIFQEEERQKIIKQIQELGSKHTPLITLFKGLHPNKTTDDLTLQEAKYVLEQFKEAM